MNDRDRRRQIRKKRKNKKVMKTIFVMLVILICGAAIAGVIWYLLTEKQKQVAKEMATTTEIVEQVITTEEVIDDRNEICQKLIASSDKIDETFAGWLYDNYEDTARTIIENSLDDKEWYRQTGKSLYVLRDESRGLLSSEESMRTNLIYQKECAGKDVVKLGFAGDISFAGDYLPGQNYNNVGISGAFSQGVQEAMAIPDIFMLNNEFAYTNGGDPQTAKGYIFRADPAKAQRLHEMGVDIVSVANNHAYDYGAQGFLDTIDALDNVGMPYVGGGKNLEDARNHIVYFIANGMKIGYIAATQVERDVPIYTQPATEEGPGVVRCYDPELVNSMIVNAKENCDFVIVYAHWGTELVNSIQEDQRALAQSFIDNGADLVMGGHAHVLQGAEFYNDVPIFYGLSNFCFSSRVRESCIVNIDISIDGIEAMRFIPCMENGGTTIKCDPGDGNYENIISLVNQNSPNIHIDEDGMVGKYEQE